MVQGTSPPHTGSVSGSPRRISLSFLQTVLFNNINNSDHKQSQQQRRHSAHVKGSCPDRARQTKSPAQRPRNNSDLINKRRERRRMDYCPPPPVTSIHVDADQHDDDDTSEITTAADLLYNAPVEDDDDNVLFDIYETEMMEIIAFMEERLNQRQRHTTMGSK